MARRIVRPNLYILPITGVIMDRTERRGFGGGASSGTTSEQVEKYVEQIIADPNACGVLLRVNSPGGLATASEAIYHEIGKLRKRMPVAAHIGGIGASGSNMASVAAERIFATEESMVGSIGVVMQIPDFSGLMESLGVRMDVFKTGSLKAAGNPYIARTSEEREYFDERLESCFDRFVSMVKERRPNIADDDWIEIVSGKVFDADEAKEIELIDELATFDEAKSQLLKVAMRCSPDARWYRAGWLTLEPKRGFLGQFLSARMSRTDTFLEKLEQTLDSFSQPRIWYI